MLRRIKSSKLMRVSLQNKFSAQQKPQNYTPRKISLSELSDLSHSLGIALHQDSMLVTATTQDLIAYGINKQNPHPTNSEKHMEFIFKTTFNPQVHPNFFKTYEYTLKELKSDYNYFEITQNLNNALGEFYDSKNGLDKITANAVNFQMFCLNEMILKSFTG